MTIIVTGGAGFIGSNFILDWCSRHDEPIVNIDKLTYAGNFHNLKPLANDTRHCFIHGDIVDRDLVAALLERHRPRALIHFAAESHVDRSIADPGNFINTNIVGTFHLLEAVRGHWRRLPTGLQKSFRFVHVSTDEVYGSLAHDEAPFTELRPYQPNSPYSASKAASDHLVRSYHHTYQLPVLTTNCSNNYGPFQFPEKLIPLMVTKAISGERLPVYGDGRQVRDWLYVKDHCLAIESVLDCGIPGATYNIGGNNEKCNVDIVHLVCDILDDWCPRADRCSYRQQIAFVADRPGHDRRYAVDPTKIERELGWRPRESFETGLQKTVRWYLENLDWLHEVQSGQHQSKVPPPPHRFH